MVSRKTKLVKQIWYLFLNIFFCSMKLKLCYAEKNQKRQDLARLTGHSQQISFYRKVSSKSCFQWCYKGHNIIKSFHRWSGSKYKIMTDEVCRWQYLARWWTVMTTSVAQMNLHYCGEMAPGWAHFNKDKCHHIEECRSYPRNGK